MQEIAPVVSGLYTSVSTEFTGKPLGNCSRCLKANKHDAGILDGMRIRKLTPLECFRLQGFSDDFFYKARAAGISNNQLYKQAGNSVTINVVYDIAKRL